MEPSDRQLVARYCRGEVDALAALLERHRRSVFGYIAAMTRGSDDAEEIFQDVWFKVIRHLPRYRDKNFAGWLVRIARNTILDRARRRKPDVSFDDDREDAPGLTQTLAGPRDDPGERLVAKELVEHIREVVERLPTSQREVFWMRVRMDLPFKEIARIQGVPLNTALARMHYAVNRLRSLLQREYTGL